MINVEFDEVVDEFIRIGNVNKKQAEALANIAIEMVDEGRDIDDVVFTLSNVIRATKEVDSVASIEDKRTYAISNKAIIVICNTALSIATMILLFKAFSLWWIVLLCMLWIKEEK